MAKTVLTVEVEYDEQVTEPEAIASAVDRLLETALSTPGVLDEQGDLRFGEFTVSMAAGAGESAHGRRTSRHDKTVRIPVEVSFTTDPAELNGCQDEPAPTMESLVAWLQDAFVLGVDTESYGQPAGAVFAAAGIDWKAATLLGNEDHETR